jgi:hypothetical protein
MHSLFTPYSLPIHSLFTPYSLPIHSLFTPYALPIHSLFTPYSLPIHFLFTSYSLPIHFLFTPYSLSIHFLLTSYSLPIHSLLTPYSLPMSHQHNRTASRLPAASRSVFSQIALRLQLHSKNHNAASNSSFESCGYDLSKALRGLIFRLYPADRQLLQ